MVRRGARRTVIAPSILSGDFARLADEAAALEREGADWLHVDVMDGHFVPNLTLGPPVVASLRKATGLFLDCHLMVEDPETWGPQFVAAGADGVTFHIEAAKDARALARRLRESGVKAGVAIKPGSVPDAALELADELDLILVMTVEPGFGGQSFMADQLAKIERVAREAPDTVAIQVDGGLDPETTPRAARAGANVIVAGSAIFKAPDRAARIKALRDAVDVVRAGPCGR